MLYPKLLEEYKSALTNKNYHFRNLTAEQFHEKAVKSFKHLPEDLQQQAMNSAMERLCKQSGTPLPPKGTTARDELIAFIQDVRFLAQTNLFFLCKLLEYSKVSDKEYDWKDPDDPNAKWEKHNTHEEICNAFFVQKDPAEFATFEGFALAYKANKVDLKQRLLLVPRGGFKSSMNMADCVQWIICFPEVTIAILTGKLDLAHDFVGEVKSHFEMEKNALAKSKSDPPNVPRRIKDALTGEYTQSMFQVLFPEHCIAPVAAEKGKMSEFQTPAYKGGDKEPSVRAAGIDQGLSGSHFCILKLDDVVTEKNSETLTTMAKMNHRVSVDKALMHPYGFFDVIGTWYSEHDYYGVQIKYDAKLRKAGDAPVFKIYRRAVWWPTQATIDAGIPETAWKDINVHLWFGERLTFEHMMEEWHTDPDGFAIKYLNDPRKIQQIKFPLELLYSRTIPWNVMPHNGLIVSVVDTAYSTNPWADYTVIITALIYGGRFFVLNMVRGRFNEYELPAVIAATGFKWKPKRICIEESMGVKWMGRELKREMEKLQISIPVEYLSLGVGNKSRSKAMKAKPVLRLLGDERLWFSKACDGLEEIYQELSQFTGTADDSHDDIVSGLSLLVEKFAPYADSELSSKANAEYVQDNQSWEHHQMIYGLGKYAKYNSEMQQDDNPVTAYQVEQAAQNMPQDPGDFDPLSDLFS